MSNPYQNTFNLIKNEHDIVTLLYDYLDLLGDKEATDNFIKHLEPLIEHNLSLRIKGNV